MKLPKEGADGLPKHGFNLITLNVILKGPKGPKMYIWSVFATIGPYSQKRGDNFS